MIQKKKFTNPNYQKNLVFFRINSLNKYQRYYFFSTIKDTFNFERLKLYWDDNLYKKYKK